MSRLRQRLAVTLKGVSRRVRLSARLWLRRHPRISRFLERAGCLNVDEFTLARGVAVGLLIGLTPTVGVQTLLMLVVSVLIRANFVAAFVASCINNPVTLPLFYFGFHQVGEQVTRYLPIRYESLSGLEAEVAEETTSLVIGSLCVALPAAVVGYVAFLYVWRRFDLHLPARVDKTGVERQHPDH